MKVNSSYPESQGGREKQASRTYRFDDVMDQPLGLVNLFLGIGHDQAVEIFFLVAGVGGIGTAFALLDGSFSANRNLGT